MVEPILYASLGALLATLAGLTFLPLFWRRAVRLTTKQLVGRLPVSASEIVAAQDRLRAEVAMSMRETERKAERAMNDATRDRVDSARSKSAELGHLADLADLRTQVAALESEGARVRGELESSGQEAAAAFEALKEARGAADAVARDLQAARQDASAARAATEQAKLETAARVVEIAALKRRIAAAEGAPADASVIAAATARPTTAGAPFGGLASGAATSGAVLVTAPSPATASTGPAEVDKQALNALRARLDEVADAIVRASETGVAPETARNRSRASPVEAPRGSQPERAGAESLAVSGA